MIQWMNVNQAFGVEIIHPKANKATHKGE